MIELIIYGVVIACSALAIFSIVDRRDALSILGTMVFIVSLGYVATQIVG